MINIENKFKLTAVAVLFIMLTVAALPYANTLATQKITVELRSALKREQQLEASLDIVRDAESALRGYALTRNDSFLTDYHSAAGRWPRLRIGLIEHDEMQQSPDRAIIALLDSKFAEMLAYVEEGGRGAAGDPKGIKAFEQGRRNSNLLWEAIGKQVDISVKRRNNLRIKLEASNTHAMLGGVAVTLINLAIFTFLLFVMLRLLNERKAAAIALEKSSKELRLLNGYASVYNSELELSAAMLHALDSVWTMEETSQIIASYCAKLFPALSGTLFLYRNSRDLLERQMHWGQPAGQDACFEPAACWALRHGRYHDASRSEDLQCSHYDRAEANIRARMCLPLVSQGDVIGLLSVEAPLQENLPFGKSRLLDRTVEQIALALNNVKLRESLHRQSIIDPLTGMFNRRYLDETLKRELSRAERKSSAISLIMIDLDHFKRINDTFGHDAGDYVLKNVAGEILANIREGDFACRFGGEELVIILPDCDSKTVHECAHRICAAIGALNLNISGRLLGKVTASLGVSSFPLNGRESIILLHKADQAMYEAKKAGRNCVRIAG